MRLAWSVYVEIDRSCNITREAWQFWKRRDSLCSYIESLALSVKGLTLAGNNIFFDLQVSGFFKYFTAQGWELSFTYEKGLTYILCIAHDKSELRIVSLTNYLEASVKALGKMLSLPKLEIDVFTDDESLLSIYCQRDTEITLEALLSYIRFIASNDLGSFSLSRASQAMMAFRHRFMTTKLYHHMDPVIIPLEEKSYFGGRTEAFRLGPVTGGPFVDLDVNSMYPFIMKTFPMPTKCIDYHDKLSVADARDLLSNYGLIADCLISTDLPIYPYRVGPKVFFPVGTFRTVLCTAALRIALQRGHVKRIHSASVYEMSNPFTAYVDYFYKVRNDAKLRGDDITQRMAKLFMNSLYGKFAQRRPILVSDVPVSFDGYSKTEIYDPVTDMYETVIRMFNRELTYYGTEVMKKSILAIPAHVTDYGRCLLWQIMETTGTERILYCDTDSVKIRQSDLHHVTYAMSEHALGALKVEDKYETLAIQGLKDYQAGRHVKLKGVPKGAVLNADGSYSYLQFLRMASHLRRGVTDEFIVKHVTKRLSREYTKGRVTPSGLVRPWVLPRDEKFAQG